MLGSKWFVLIIIFLDEEFSLISFVFMTFLRVTNYLTLRQNKEWSQSIFIKSYEQLKSMWSLVSNRIFLSLHTVPLPSCCITRHPTKWPGWARCRWLVFAPHGTSQLAREGQDSLTHTPGSLVLAVGGGASALLQVASLFMEPLWSKMPWVSLPGGGVLEAEPETTRPLKA